MNKQNDKNQLIECELKTKYFTITNPLICKLYMKYFNIKLLGNKQPKEYCFIISFNKNDDSEIMLYANLIKNQPKEKHFVTERLSYYTEEHLDGNNRLELPYIYSTHIVNEIVYEYSPTLRDREDLIVLYRQSDNTQKEKDHEIIIKMIATMYVLLENYQERAEYEHHNTIDREKLNSRIREINSLYGELEELIQRVEKKELLMSS